MNTDDSGRTSNDRGHPAPVDIILAGRHAAGCDMNRGPLSEDQLRIGEEDYEEFLCVGISDETYGINILQIKEIIKPRQVTEIPRTPSSVSGVISLRGMIIPVLNTPEQLGLKPPPATSEARVVVVKTSTGCTGLLVNKVFKVVRVSRSCVESAPAVVRGIDRTFVSGIGRADNCMLILLNVERVAEIPPW
ncbi:MAG: purine-binding chemotaxis protein CheW [Desulfuromonadales bacterium]|nr:purine-binding chemotaxis protein CheW [Desulfuromonadales bacterium]